MSQAELDMAKNTETLEAVQAPVEVSIVPSVAAAVEGIGLETHGSITSTLSTEHEKSEFLHDIIESSTVQLDEVALKSDGYACVCIDGRCAACLANSDKEVPIRQKMAGGNLMTATAGIELAQSATARELGNGSVDDRMRRAAELLTSKGHGVAGHNSTRATAENNECGAAMALVISMRAIQHQTEAVMRITHAVLGTEYDETATERVSTNAKAYADRLEASDWSGTQLTQAISDIAGDDHIETLASDESATHNHLEEAVVFDWREGTTNNRDRQSRQVFWVDMDAIRRVAEAVSNSPSEAETNMQMMTAMQVATYIALCDGTHPVAIVR